jgi:hypothetical protein
MFIPDPDLDYYPSRIPDPRVTKAPDPGSATLQKPFTTNMGALKLIHGKSMLALQFSKVDKLYQRKTNLCVAYWHSV